MPNICLNMIVRNEAGRILRALEAAAPHITSYCIVDTGSTDDTLEIVRSFFDDYGTPGIIAGCEFHNFSQARNFALEQAHCIRSTRGGYILLQDADMELMVEDPDAFRNLTANAYTMVQKSGALSYHNTRLIRMDAPGGYVGVTHEYLDIGPTLDLTGAYFIDHADGSNRVNKFERDIKLLTEALETDPTNSRYWFYLGQSYRDAGRPAEAARAYAKRVELGGWDEESWNAKCNVAAAERAMGNESAFIATTLEAYNDRPTRAETLYDLAKHYREKGHHNTSLLFSRMGMATPRPNDKLFVNDYVYSTGLREEFSICAFYDPTRRAEGAAVCDALSLDPAGTDTSRSVAKSNMYHYLQPIAVHAPSFNAVELPLVPDAGGYKAMNPSVAIYNGNILVNVRYVNYTIASDGSYQITAEDGSISRTNPIHTKNYIVQLAPNLLDMQNVKPINWSRPDAKFDLVLGLEDVRLIPTVNGLFGVACARELNEAGFCEQVLFKLADTDSAWKVTHYETLSAPNEPTEHQKNWMPILTHSQYDGLRTGFMYRPDVYIPNDASCAALAIYKPSSLKVDQVSGSSQLVPFNCGYLAVLHESGYIPGTHTRYYQHRFAWFDSAFKLHRLSLPFVFEAKQIEFCAGLAIHPRTKQIIVSYGVRDEIAKLATIDVVDVQQMLWCYYE